MYKFLTTLLTLFLAGSAFSQDHSNDILLVGVSQLANEVPRFEATQTYLSGLYAATSGYEGAEVDLYINDDAESVLNLYYNPNYKDTFIAKITEGYKYVVIACDSEFGVKYPELYFEECYKMSQAILAAGSIPIIAMHDDPSDTSLLEIVYRVANGCGLEVVPYAQAIDDISDSLDSSENTGEGMAQRAYIAAASIYSKLTGIDPNTTGYEPTYTADNSQVRSLDGHEFLANTGTQTNAYHETIDDHYSTSYGNIGNVRYRPLDISSAPFNNQVPYLYRGTSTEEGISERLNTIINETMEAELREVTYINRFQKGWDDGVNTSSAASSAFNQFPNGYAFMYVRWSYIDAQEVIDTHNQTNMLPIVFERIDYSYGSKGTASTTAVLSNCFDTAFYSGSLSYGDDGWAVIPFCPALGRLAEIEPDIVTSSDGVHMTDPLYYMTAAMMLTSSLGSDLDVPSSIQSDSQLVNAFNTGKTYIAQSAFLSGTGSHVPDSNLIIETDSLPDLPPSGSYGYQLLATGGVGGLLWELLPETTLPAGLSLSVNGLLHGTVTETGTWSVALKVTDSQGSFRQVGFTLASGIVEASDITVQLSSYDPALISLPNDGSGVSTYAYSAPVNGALTGTGYDLTYTPNAGITSDGFSYTITSGGVTSDSKTVTIQVVLPDGQAVGAPDADDTTVQLDEDGSIEIPLTGFDAEGDFLMGDLVSQPTNGRITSLVGNVASYKPDANYYGLDSFTFKMNDGALDSATAEVTITVNPVNDATPLATAISESVGINESVAVTLSATDVDNDSITYTVVSEPTYGELSGTVPNLTYTPNTDYTGNDNFTYVANDGYGDSELATIAVSVFEIPEIQVVGSGDGYDLTGSEVSDFRSTGTAKTFDADGDDSYGSTGYFFAGIGDTANVNNQDFSRNSQDGPSWVTEYAAGSHFASIAEYNTYDSIDNPTLTPAATVDDWARSAICVASAGEVGEWRETLTFTVDGTVPPSFRLGVMAGNEHSSDGRYDPAGLRLSFEGLVSAEVTNLPAELGMVFFDVTLPADSNGTFSVEVQTRSKGPTITGIVFDVDHKLYFADPPVGDVNAVNAAYSGSLAGSASDVDGDGTLIYSVQEGPSWLTVASDGSMSGTPAGSDLGINYWTLQVANGSGEVATTPFQITVVDSLLIGYDFDSDAADLTAVSVVPTGVSASSITSPMGISFITSIGDNSGADALGIDFGSSGTLGSIGISVAAATTTTFEDAVAGDDYMAFTLSPDEGVILDLRAITLKATKKAETSVDEYALTDALGNLIGSPGAITTLVGLAGEYESVVFSFAGSSYEAITEATEFRIYAWGRGTSNTSSTLAALDKITVYGSLYSDSEYSIWASGYGLGGDDALAVADTENGGAGDGYSNLLEFALGMDPTVNDAGVSESNYTEEDAGTEYFVYEYERRTDYLELGLTYSLIVTPDLLTPSGEVPNDVEIGTAVDDYETVKTRFEMTDSAKFIQLQVEME
ncbi:Ig-like domain-containing protein [Rubritalea sp.]|uniref:Ig-like domain-containing protein n=1 Tax=Rubritalea sp. TaxID=2109375 RepID=UPI003EF78EBD